MLLNRNRSELHFSSSYERLICSEELGNRHQTPTLIGCIFLRNLASNSALRFLLLPAFAAISEALNYRSFLEDLSTSGVSTDSLCCRFAYRDSAALRVQQSLEFYTSFLASGNSSAFFFPLCFHLAATSLSRCFAVFSRAIDYSTQFRPPANALHKKKVAALG